MIHRSICLTTSKSEAPRARSRADLSIFLPFLTIYLSTLSQRAQLLARNTALVRRRVLRPVLLAAVRRHLALATLDINICSFLALRVVADPIQLFAETLVLGPVLHGVVLAAVQRHSAPGTLMQGRPVDCLYPARRVVALSDFPLFVLRSFDYSGVTFLCSEISMHTVTKE